MTGPATSLKHLGVAAMLEQEIRSGQVGRGRRLPGENMLAARFDVSRTTVRQALTALGRAGLITTHPGKGSFVTYDDAPLDAWHGWAVAFKKRGIATAVEVRRLERTTDPDLAAALGQSSAEFVAIDRIRHIVDGPAVSYERSRVPVVDGLADLPERGLLEGSLTATLLRAGLHADRGEQWVGARLLEPAEADILGRSPRDWFLATRRVTRTIGGDLVEHVESALDPAHVQLHLRFD